VPEPTVALPCEGAFELPPDSFAQAVPPAPPAPLAARDRLWCRAVLEVLDLDTANAVLARFNALRLEVGAP
jgi:hypothetical protein